jgi:hypothetical protein
MASPANAAAACSACFIRSRSGHPNSVYPTDRSRSAQEETRIRRNCGNRMILTPRVTAGARRRPERPRRLSQDYGREQVGRNSNAYSANSLGSARPQYGGKRCAFPPYTAISASARRGSGTSASKPSNDANSVTATSNTIATPRSRHSPMREAPLYPELHFTHSGLQRGLTSAHPAALNSLGIMAPAVVAVFWPDR